MDAMEVRVMEETRRVTVAEVSERSRAPKALRALQAALIRVKVIMDNKNEPDEI